MIGASHNKLLNVSYPKGADLYARGYNIHSQVRGDGTVSETATSQKIAENVRFVTSNGIGHTLIQFTTGIVRGFGWNYYGEARGDGSHTPDSEKPSSEIIGRNMAGIGSGYECSYFITNENRLQGFGYDSLVGKLLGDGTVHSSPNAQNVNLGTNVAQVACGIDHTLFLKNDTSVYAMGGNSNGQSRNDGTTSSAQLTANRVLISGGAKVACGIQASYILRTDGSVLAWGRNTDGEVRGNGTSSTREPVQYILETGVADISANADSSHVLLLMNDGSVKSFGGNAHSKVLGTGSTASPQLTSTVVATGVQAISAGASHTLLLMDNGDVRGYGSGLHLETAGSVSTVLDTNAIGIHAGSRTTFILKRPE